MLETLQLLADELEDEIRTRTGRNPKFGEVTITVPHIMQHKLLFELGKLHNRFPSSGNPRLGCPDIIVINEFLFIRADDGKDT